MRSTDAPAVLCAERAFFRAAKVVEVCSVFPMENGTDLNPRGPVQRVSTEEEHPEHVTITGAGVVATDDGQRVGVDRGPVGNMDAAPRTLAGLATAARGGAVGPVGDGLDVQQRDRGGSRGIQAAAWPGTAQRFGPGKAPASITDQAALP